eukprot:scaffold134394_cov48-Prasinocladus_malaysianus.AAC.3
MLSSCSRRGGQHSPLLIMMKRDYARRYEGIKVSSSVKEKQKQYTMLNMRRERLAGWRLASD